MNITNKRVFWYSFSVSLVVFLTSEWWVSSINFYLSNCITAICTFAMTFICLEHFKVDGKTKYLLVCTSVFLGRSILQIPIHIFAFTDSFHALFFLITTIVNTILAAVCYKEKKLTTFILCFIVFLLMTTLVSQTWSEAISIKMGITD